jgi:hypothetical protein
MMLIIASILNSVEDPIHNWISVGLSHLDFFLHLRYLFLMFGSLLSITTVNSLSHMVNFHQSINVSYA